jgi:hypothetical protein
MFYFLTKGSIPGLSAPKTKEEGVSTGVTAQR